MKSIGFGIVGAGVIAKVHARSLKQIDGSHLEAVFNPHPGKAKAFAQEYGCKGFEDMASFLDAVDAVIIATPSGDHLEGALAAIEAGKPVLVEKPLEVTIERADRIIRAAEEKGVLLAGVFHSRFFELSSVIKKAIDSGRLGKIVLADAYIKWYRSQEYYDSALWRGTWDKDGGGILMNQGIHAVDLLQYFMGPVKSIGGVVRTINHERIEVEDTATATLEFENGALGVIEGTTGCYPGYKKRIEIYGSEGSIVMEENYLKAWDMKNPTQEDERIKEKYLDKPNADEDGHLNELAVFADNIREGTRPMIDGREARKAIELIEAIYKSSKEEGRRINLPL
ncbi:MAG: Gfo/Idh/MocA family oxidoreductase [Sphaerochaetaceae bacterium]|nr:Gfo/Idh/MocA family oxidoreductase [Sphaerochaetaceae bacterium]